MRRSPNGLTCFFLVSLLAGCGSGTTDAPTKEGGGNRSREIPPPGRECGGADTTPVTLERLLQVFRAKGITMFNDPICQLPVDEWAASNVPLYGPDAADLDESMAPEDDARDHIVDEQGAVYCDARAETHPLTEEGVHEVRYEGDYETHFSVANVTCSIYPEEGKEAKQLLRLRQAMADLVPRS